MEGRRAQLENKYDQIMGELIINQVAFNGGAGVHLRWQFSTWLASTRRSCVCISPETPRGGHVDVFRRDGGSAADDTSAQPAILMSSAAKWREQMTPPQNVDRLYAVLMLGHRRRRWPNIRTA